MGNRGDLVASALGYRRLGGVRGICLLRGLYGLDCGGSCRVPPRILSLLYYYM